MRRSWVAAVAAVALLGCGEDDSTDAGSNGSAEQEAATKELERARKDLERERRRLERERRDKSESGAAESGGADAGAEEGIVPDVVGKDHQLAQDTMQAAGFYVLEEEDATGQGRLLIVDRNWTVVEQDPPAGTRASPDQTITLRSKKDDE